MNKLVNYRMNKCIIFGLSCFSDLVANYIEEEKTYEIVAYTVNKEYLDVTFHNNKPVVALEELEKFYNMDNIDIINTVGYSKMNGLREKVFYDIKKLNYKIGSFYSEKSLYYSNIKDFGVGNIILPFSHIGLHVTIGNNNIIFSGVNLTHEITIGNNNFIASGTTIGGYVKIENNCFLGLNSTIKNKVAIRDRTLVGASTYIHEDTEKDGVYVPQRCKKLKKNSVYFI